MQEEIEQKTFNIMISTTKLSARTVLRAVKAAIRLYQSSRFLFPIYYVEYCSSIAVSVFFISSRSVCGSSTSTLSRWLSSHMTIPLP